MGASTQNFAGIETNIPGTYTKAEFPPAPGSGRTAGNVVVIMGESKGGVPAVTTDTDILDDDKINQISSLAQAKDLLVSGNGYYMTEFFMTPSNDPNLNTPTNCKFVRVNNGVRATSIIKSSVGSVNTIDLKSARWGALGNQLSRKIEAGSSTGKKVSLKFKGVDILTQDNVSYIYFNIQYTGAATVCTMSINATTLTTTTASVNIPADDLSLTLADYKTIEALVAYIDQHPSYTCTLVQGAVKNPNTLDVVSSQSIVTAYDAKADVEAVIDMINGNSKGEVTATLSSGATRILLANDASFIFFSGGSDSTASSNDWATAFALLEKFSVNHILIATGDSTIHSMLSQHLTTMSSIENKQNRSGGAGALNTHTISQKKSNARLLNNARMEYWATGIYRPDALNGNVNTLFDPFYGAALGAGIRFSNNTTISATFKTVNILGVAEKYSIQTTKDLIASGCSLIADSPRGFAVKHNVTTYQGENLILELPSMLRTADYISLDIIKQTENRMASLLSAPTAMVIKEMQNYVVTNLLPSYRDQGLLTNDPYSKSPAFSDVEFNLFGDRFEVSFTGIIPAPLHFTFITEKFVIVGYSRKA